MRPTRNWCIARSGRCRWCCATLVLREMEQLSYKEIGKITEVPISTVMYATGTGRKQLQALLLAEELYGCRFFAFSGFLLASSRQRLPVYAFAWRRALRILPAYWVCIALTAGLCRLVVCGGHPQPFGLDRWPAMGRVRIATPLTSSMHRCGRCPSRSCYVAGWRSCPGAPFGSRQSSFAVLLAATAAGGWAFGLWLPRSSRSWSGCCSPHGGYRSAGHTPLAAAARLRGRRLAGRNPGGGRRPGVRDAVAGDVATRTLAERPVVRHVHLCVSGDPAPGPCRSVPIWAARLALGAGMATLVIAGASCVHHRASRDLAEVDPTSRKLVERDGRGRLIQGGLRADGRGDRRSARRGSASNLAAGGHDPIRR